MHLVQRVDHLSHMQPSGFHDLRRCSLCYTELLCPASGSPPPSPLPPPFSLLSASWRMLLLGDASPTRLLSLLSGAPMQVQVLAMQELEPGGLGGAPEAWASLLLKQQQQPSSACPHSSSSSSSSSTLVRRTVWLRSGAGAEACRAEASSAAQAPSGPPLGYAVSWWGSADVAACLPDASQPIGSAVAQARREVHKELLAVSAGQGHAELEAGLSREGSPPSGSSSSWLLGRWYFLWHAGKRLCLVHEVFSAGLEGLLGPQLQAA
jgi:chorismate--pyruvate lyase